MKRSKVKHDKMRYACILEFSKETGPIGCVCKPRKIYFNELALAIMDSGKLKPALCDDRLETHRKAKAAVKSQGRLLAEFPLAQKGSVFVLLKPSVDWMRPTHSVESNWLYWVHWFKYQSHPKTPSYRIIFYQIPGTVSQQSCHIKLTITEFITG